MTKLEDLQKVLTDIDTLLKIYASSDKDNAIQGYPPQITAIKVKTNTIDTQLKLSKKLLTQISVTAINMMHELLQKDLHITEKNPLSNVYTQVLLLDSEVSLLKSKYKPPVETSRLASVLLSAFKKIPKIDTTTVQSYLERFKEIHTQVMATSQNELVKTNKKKNVIRPREVVIANSPFEPTSVIPEPAIKAMLPIAKPFDPKPLIDEIMRLTTVINTLFSDVDRQNNTPIKSPFAQEQLKEHTRLLDKLTQLKKTFATQPEISSDKLSLETKIASHNELLSKLNPLISELELNKSQLTNALKLEDETANISAELDHQLIRKTHEAMRPINKNITDLNTTDKKGGLDALEIQVQAKKSSKPVCIVQKMTEKITYEVLALYSPDARIPILEAVSHKLKGAIDIYCKSTSQTKEDFISNSVAILKDEFSSNKLNQLSDLEAGWCINFVRGLIELFKRIFSQAPSENYSPQFFASNTETNLASNAKKVIGELDSLGQTLDQREQLIQPPLDVNAPG